MNCRTRQKSRKRLCWYGRSMIRIGLPPYSCIYVNANVDVDVDVDLDMSSLGWWITQGIGARLTRIITHVFSYCLPSKNPLPYYQFYNTSYTPTFTWTWIIFWGGGGGETWDRGIEGTAIESRSEFCFSTTNRENTGLISVDRSNKATLLLTIPSSVI